MRKLYQTSWHGIAFDSFTKVSSTRLADPSFYDSFYRSFFIKYETPEELSPEWKRLKVRVTEHLENEILRAKTDSILSIGCGLGIMEMHLLQKGYIDLEVTETSEAPLKWIRKVLAGDRIHVTSFPETVPSGKRYDVILLSSVDYFLNDAELNELLRQARDHLKPRGNCTLLSWSFDLGTTGRWLTACRSRLDAFLEWMSLRHRGQFWGYIRTREEYRAAFRCAGLSSLSEEVIETGTPWKTFRISGIHPVESELQPCR